MKYRRIAVELDFNAAPKYPGAITRAKSAPACAASLANWIVSRVLVAPTPATIGRVLVEFISINAVLAVCISCTRSSRVFNWD